LNTCPKIFVYVGLLFISISIFIGFKIIYDLKMSGTDLSNDTFIAHKNEANEIENVFLMIKYKKLSVKDKLLYRNCMQKICKLNKNINETITLIQKKEKPHKTEYFRSFIELSFAGYALICVGYIVFPLINQFINVLN